MFVYIYIYIYIHTPYHVYYHIYIYVGNALPVETKQEEERSNVELNEAAIAWKNAWVVKLGSLITYDGKFPLNPRYLERPEDVVSARQRSESIVQTTQTSFLTKGLLEYQIIILIWAEDYYGNRPHNGIFEYNILDKPTYTLQVIAGDHTCEAIRRILVENPSFLQHNTVNCVVIICPRTRDNEKYANVYGNLCNFIKNTATKANIVEITMQIHDKYMAIANMQYLDNQKKKLRSEICKTYVSSSVFKSTTLGSASALAQRTGKVWKLLQRVFLGEVVQRPEQRTKFKPPTGISNFINTANIPEERLCKWLQRICDGLSTTKQFQDSCMAYKKHMKVHALILEFCNTLRGDHKIDTMVKLLKKYPLLDDKPWLNMIVGWTGTAAKDRLTPEARNSIRRKLETNERQIADEIKRKVPKIYCNI